MSADTIERTALAGGDGDDSRYIQEGIDDAEALLKLELSYGVGEFVPRSVEFAKDALGKFQHNRRGAIGIDTGRLAIGPRRGLIPYTPWAAQQVRIRPH
jgi:hypothetical protein